MKNDYSYIDPDYTYTDTQTGVLRNRENIQDHQLLVAIDKNDSDKIAGNLAEILDTANYLHPFREGNGRTQREFLQVLALEKGYALNLNPADNAGVGKLADLILELMRGGKHEKK